EEDAPPPLPSGHQGERLTHPWASRRELEGTASPSAKPPAPVRTPPGAAPARPGPVSPRCRAGTRFLGRAAATRCVAAETTAEAPRSRLPRRTLRRRRCR